VGDQTVTFFWRSEGFREDGEPVPRQGRASIVLRRTERNATGFEAVHSHFSMLPNGRLF
jgi:ketosteroid isomerase-like protein